MEFAPPVPRTRFLRLTAPALLLCACSSSATVPHDDAGTSPEDAGADAGMDAALPDASPPDDGGPADSGLPDSGPPDSGLPDAAAPSCTDGLQNGSETGIDCGGTCLPCAVSPSAVPFVAGRSSLFYDYTPAGYEPVDLDGDGKLDIVVKSFAFTTGFGNGDGVFAPTTAFAMGSDPLNLAGHGDFDGDGRGDVVGCFGNNGLQVFRGSSTTASGLLDETNPKFVLGSSSYLSACTTADFNGDGKPDVAIGTTSGTVELGLNSGTALVPGASYAGFAGVGRLVAFDVDGLLGADLLAAGGSPAKLQLLLSKGDGTFTQQPAVALPATVTDLVPFRESSTSVALLASGGALSVATLASSGALGTPVALGGAQVYTSVAAGDLDGNGTVELVATRLLGGFVDVFEHLGATWQIKQTVRPNALPRSVRLVDWNGDGRLDLTVMNTSPVTIDVLLNLGNGTFPSPPQVALDAAPFSGGAIGDLDGDGRPDVLIPVDSIPNQSYVDVYLTKAAGGFTKAAHAVLPNQGQSFLVGEFTGDGKSDVIALDSFNKVTLLTGDGAGGLAATTSFYGVSDAFGLALGDVAATGHPQLLLPAPGGINAYDPVGSFFGGTAHVVSPSMWPELRAVADVDGDGKADLVMSGLFNGGFGWQRSLGGYQFGPVLTLGGNLNVQAVLPLTLGALPRRWLVVSDDGLHDWTETASGVTDTPVGGTTGNHLVRGDWNHDGIEDLMVVGAVVSLYRGEPGGTYTFTGTTLLGGGLANAAGYFDATGDGVKDLVLVNHYGGITVLAGTP